LSGKIRHPRQPGERVGFFWVTFRRNGNRFFEILDNWGKDGTLLKTGKWKTNNGRKTWETILHYERLLEIVVNLRDIGDTMEKCNALEKL
jgi:hypothetical protein